ncbi:type II toxin-antitoxin system RelE family toxin [Pseudomonas lundensis]|uniref:Type II toxin-antitoxin system mRNA interferase toxin, RelE/StbE family n=1 Tax=Pseudomonas lundensis TaxID=86185 RepID=A0ABX4GHL9_9PSED|nr:type II toxin-antitoxin system RelE/ParE family toxin [Pseudomonas lundensis]NMZ54143.1 type II toxin-antitoxin system RelE/ParE family toxin [Pseudomonas lundensis]OZY53596.1 type II toxin-antitoxin system mRNA interferase toxin, RelE/StbE family [Pseudomonas lundensis]
MGAEYEVEWNPKALKELRQLDGAVRLQFLRKLQERQSHPRVPGDALYGLKDCYKIKLRGAGYRLVYRVEDERIVILVLAIGKRERSLVYEQAGKR